MKVTQHGILTGEERNMLSLSSAPSSTQVLLTSTILATLDHKRCCGNTQPTQHYQEAHWLIARDYNNIEHPRDKQGGSSQTSIHTRELEAWTQLLTRVGVRDVFNMGAFCRKSNKAFRFPSRHVGSYQAFTIWLPLGLPPTLVFWVSVVIFTAPGGLCIWYSLILNLGEVFTVPLGLVL